MALITGQRFSQATPTISSPRTVFPNVSYAYTTNAVTDPDGGQIRYHINGTGPGTPYNYTTTWYNSGMPMSWELVWEPTDNPRAYLIQACVEDSYGMLSNLASQVFLIVRSYMVDCVEQNVTWANSLANYFETVAQNGSPVVLYSDDVRRPVSSVCVCVLHVTWTLENLGGQGIRKFTLMLQEA